MSINAGTVAQIRSASERLTMVARCTILRATVTEPAPGYEVETFNTHLANVPCSLPYNSTRQERETTDSSVVIGQRRVIVPVDTDVTNRDRIGSITGLGEIHLSSVNGVPITIEPNLAHLVLILQEVG